MKRVIVTCTCGKNVRTLDVMDDQPFQKVEYLGECSECLKADMVYQAKLKARTVGRRR